MSPILKPNKDPKEAVSYRPISLTSHMGKILESIVKFRLSCHFDNKNIISKTQSGFRHRRQAIEQVALLETDIRTCKMQRGQGVIAIFLDLEKAFDIMDRDRLLQQMIEVGIEGNMLAYIKDFLSDRFFRVKVGNSLSEERVLENGSPQGAVLSPILFQIAVNNLSKVQRHKNTKVGQYCDDSSAWRAVGYRESLGGAIYSFSEDCTNLVRHLKEVGLKVNTSKTQAIFFGNGELTLNIDGTLVKTQNEVTYLGVVLDKHLTYKTHIGNVCKKARKSLNLLHLLSKNKNAPKSTQFVVYKNLVEAKLTYGQELYESAPKTHLNKVDRIHSASLRALTNACKSTTIQSMEVLTGEMPPPLKRSKARIDLWTRTHAVNDNPLAESLDKPANQKTYWGYKRTPKILGLSRDLKHDLDLLSLNANMITKIPQHPHPYLWPDPQIDLSLTSQISKKNDSVDIMKSLTLEHIDSTYSSHTKIYTDGSKLPNTGRVGSGAFSATLGKSINQRITDHAAITTAELHAISMSLDQIVRNPPPKTVILTDSLSSCKMILSADPGNHRFDVISQIRISLQNIQNKNKEIVICWIPSHVDIAGNDTADSLALEATIINDVQYDIKLGTGEMKALTKNRLKHQVWEQQWQTSDKGSFTRKLIPSVVHPKIRYGAPKLNRITRLRLGWPRFRAAPDPYCLTCDCPKDIEHVLLECRNFNTERQTLITTFIKNKVPFTINNLLAPQAPKSVFESTLSFINSIDELI